jgi:hypothetical protein
MNHRTAVSHLRLVAEACERYFGRRANPLCVAAYAHGEVVEGMRPDGDDAVDAASVVFALDLPPEEVPYGIESREVRGFVQHFIRVPLHWSCRPATGPIATVEVRKPVRFWSLDGVDTAVLDALAKRRLDDLPVEPDPDPADRAIEVSRALAHLRSVVDHFWEPRWRREHKGGGVYPEQHLWNAAFAYLQLIEPLTGTAAGAEPEANVPGWEREAIDRLHAAVDSGNGAAVVEALQDRPLAPVLQLAGEGLLDALAQRAGGESEAVACVTALRGRGWTGDEVLADDLEAALGRSKAERALRPVPVDLAELAECLDQSESSRAEPSRVDLGDGRTLEVPPQGSHDAYWDMKEFTTTVSDRSLRQLLDVALGGRGAFRRFREVLSAYPEERERWNVFSHERTRGRARAWLAEQGYRVAGRQSLTR